MEWTNDAVIRLVKGYQKRPELWDNCHGMYRVYTAKHEAWDELAAMFDCDVMDIKKKVNSLLASHRREKAKVRDGGRSTWFLYSHLKFLPTHVPDSTGDIDIQHIEFLEPESHVEGAQDAEYLVELHEEEGEGAGEELDEEVLIKQEPPPDKKTVIYMDGDTIRKSKPRARRLLRNLKRKQQTSQPASSAAPSSINTGLLEIVKSLRHLKRRDECDSFGEYIANSLRKHDERTRSMIKHAINNILFEQEMKKYSATQYELAVTHDDDDNPLILETNMDDDH